ncbi:MAG: hypothetical protein RLZZ480_117 [Candidatus Parcubacteria bacterium]|jgi:hypothetical protein
MQDKAKFMLAEFREFAAFTPREQRYIKRSIDVAFGDNNPVREWARDPEEERSIRNQDAAYTELKPLKELTAKPFSVGLIPKIMPILTAITAFDLAQDGLQSFNAYRFLYERLLGARSRQWLPGAFCGAAALPHLKPERRKLLLQSISENAATAQGWSEQEPFFFPKWVDKEDLFL